MSSHTIISKPNVTLIDGKQLAEEETPKLTVLQWFKTNWRNILSEFLSTASLLFFGCMSCIPLEGYDVQPLMYSTFGFGLVILVNVQTFGHLSGAHMNPVVTLASVMWGATSPALGVAYFIVQCLGSTCGYYLLMTLAPNDFERAGFCVTQPKTTLTSMQAVAIEAMLGAALIFFCCCMWDPVNKNKQESVSVKFGLAIIGLGLCGGPLTGASINPARSLGPAIVSGTFKGLWIYWCGPLIGSLVGLFTYKNIWLTVEDEQSCRAKLLKGQRYISCAKD